MYECIFNNKPTIVIDYAEEKNSHSDSKQAVFLVTLLPGV
jgi:hypothetical protein